MLCRRDADLVDTALKQMKVGIYVNVCEHEHEHADGHERVPEQIVSRVVWSAFSLMCCVGGVVLVYLCCVSLYRNVSISWSTTAFRINCTTRR
jgi:hypothetical protein